MVGASVGLLVGASVGLFVGASVGLSVGASVGACVGTSVGLVVGNSVGLNVGLCVGSSVGLVVGALVGPSVGALVGLNVGLRVGLSVGDWVGELVLYWQIHSKPGLRRAWRGTKSRASQMRENSSTTRCCGWEHLMSKTHSSELRRRAKRDSDHMKARDKRLAPFIQCYKVTASRHLLSWSIRDLLTLTWHSSHY